jgi:hypothetical protein
MTLFIGMRRKCSPVKKNVLTFLLFLTGSPISSLPIAVVIRF